VSSSSASPGGDTVDESMDDSGLDRLDRAIDDAARQLTAGDPPLHFRAAVIARLGKSGRAERRWLIAPLAAAAVLAGLFVIERAHRGNEIPVRPAVRPADIALRRTADAPPVRPAAADTSAAATVRAAPRRLPPAPIDPSPVTALAPDALAVAPLVVGDLESGPSTRLDPLQPIAPLAIAPLDAEGDHP
jgi:hypothetical protein